MAELPEIALYRSCVFTNLLHFRSPVAATIHHLLFVLRTSPQSIFLPVYPNKIKNDYCRIICGVNKRTVKHPLKWHKNMTQILSRLITLM